MEMEQQRKIEESMKKMVLEIDTEHLRKIQAVMHRCAARCCENSTASMETVHSCVQNCSVTLNEAQNFVQNEFSTLQNRLQRCIMDCNDDIKDKMSGLNTNDSDKMETFNLQFEKCAVKCVDKHLEQLPNMLKRMKEVLGKKQQQSALYYPS